MSTELYMATHAFLESKFCDKEKITKNRSATNITGGSKINLYSSSLQKSVTKKSTFGNTSNTIKAKCAVES